MEIIIIAYLVGCVCSFMTSNMMLNEIQNRRFLNGGPGLFSKQDVCYYMIIVVLSWLGVVVNYLDFRKL